VKLRAAHRSRDHRRAGTECARYLPQALPSASSAVASLKPFNAMLIDGPGELMIRRTGYTGEDGFEVVLPVSEARTWTASAKRRRPCGLGARDTLRLEAGMNLYGQDMDETVTPLESGLWVDRRPVEPARFHRQGGARRPCDALPATRRARAAGQGRRAARAQVVHTLTATARSRAARSARRSISRSRFARVPGPVAPGDTVKVVVRIASSRRAS
jgi:aminomethyltransferase